MRAVRRLLVLPIVVGAIVGFSALAAAPTPAQADNCQAEQLPPLNQPPLMPEEADPRCIVLKAAGCPNVVDQAACIAGIRDATVRGNCDFNSAVSYASCRIVEALGKLPLL